MEQHPSPARRADLGLCTAKQPAGVVGRTSDGDGPLAVNGGFFDRDLLDGATPDRWSVVKAVRGGQIRDSKLQSPLVACGWF